MICGHNLFKFISSLFIIKTAATIFSFVDTLSATKAKNVMASFDVASLFTNVPRDEVIEIIAEYAYENKMRLAIPLCTN